MRTSTPELTLPSSDLESGAHLSPVTEGEFHLEAASVEAAVADVRRRTGRDPDVLDVEHITRGGLGGFFAREMVRVHVRIGGSVHPTGPTLVADSPTVASGAVTEARPHGIDSVLQQLTQEHDQRERGFEAQLRRALAEGRPVTPGQVRQAAPVTRSAPVAPVARPAVQPAAEPATALFDQHPDLAPEPPAPAPAPRPEPTAAPAAAVPAASAEPVATGEPEQSGRSLIAPEVRERLQGHRPDAPTTAVAHVEEPVIEGELVEDDEPTPAPVAAPAAPAAATTRSRSLAGGSPLATARALRPGARWNHEALYALGLPGTVLDRLELGIGADEFAWLRAMSEAVAPWCRSLPTGAAVLVGPRAAGLGRALDIPVCERRDRVPYGGDVALVASDAAAGRGWIEEVRGDRWLHLVVGGRRWEGLVAAAPRAVSVVGRDRVPEALALCASFDLVLGHLLADARSTDAIRMTPLDVALAIREQLPRAEGA